MAVGQSQRLYSGVRTFTGNYLSSTPRELRASGVELELTPLIYDTTDDGAGRKRFLPVSVSIRNQWLFTFSFPSYIP
jgi:hypothetical protein